MKETTFWGVGVSQRVAPRFCPGAYVDLSAETGVWPTTNWREYFTIYGMFE